MDHLLEALGGAEHLDRFAVPCLALLGQRAWFVLGLAGLQGRLLGQLDGLDRCGRAAVGGLERCGEDRAAVLDVEPPLGEAAVQVGVDADDLAHRPLAGVLVGALGEAHPEGVDQVPLECGVVGLRGRDDRLVQGPAVDGQPGPVEGLDLVGHGDVGVQVGVPGAGVAVGERGGDQAADVDLTHPVGAAAGEQRLGLDEVDRVLDGRLVGPFDHRCGLRVGDRPERRDALDRGEGEVVAGDRVRLRARVLGDGGGELAGVGRFATVLGAEELGRDLGADLRPLGCGYWPVAGEPGRLVHRGDAPGDLDPERADVVLVDLVRRAQPGCGLVVGLGGGVLVRSADLPVKRLGAFGGQRVMAGSEQVLHVVGGDQVAGVQPLDEGHAGSDPYAGGFALLGVVAGKAGVALVGGVHRGDLAGQVVVPRARGELVDAHRHGHLGPAGPRGRSPRSGILGYSIY